MAEFNPQAEVRKILRERMTGDLLEVGPDTYHEQLRAVVEGWKGLLSESLERLLRVYTAYEETSEDGMHAESSYKARVEERVRNIESISYSPGIENADDPADPQNFSRKEILGLLLSMLAPNYTAPKWTHPIANMLALNCCIWFARALLNGVPFSTETLGVLTLTWGKIAAAAERDIQNIAEIYPRVAATRHRVKLKADRRTTRRDAIVKIAEGFKPKTPKASLDTYVMKQLVGTEHEVAEKTVRTDIKALRKEGRLPPK